MACKHFECVFYAPKTETCDYLIITGHSRGCSVEECDKLTSDASSVTPLVKDKRLRIIDLDAIHRLERVYTPNKSVSQMAREARVSKNFVFLWGKQVHPEAKTQFFRREINGRD